MADYAEHVVDSVYVFRFPDELIEQFRSPDAAYTLSHVELQLTSLDSSIPESTDCHTTYKDAKFRIQCPRGKGQRVLSAFLEIYTTYIETFTRPAEEVDTFELPKVSRRVETAIDDDPNAIYEEPGNTKEPDENKGVIDIGATLINHESVVRVYESSRPEEFTTQTLRAVEKLTHCTIIVDGVKAKITLKGDTVGDVNKVFEKLVAISKSYSRRASGFTSFDFYIPENEVNFRFQFHSPERVIDRHILLYLPNFLSEYSEIHMVRWHSSSASWIRVPNRPSIPHPLENTPDHPWFEHVYPALGCENGEKVQVKAKARKTHDYLAPAQVNKMTAWTENIPLQPDNPFNGIPTKDDTAPAALPSTITHPRDYMKSRRVLKEHIEPTLTVTDDVTIIIPQPPPIAEPYMPEEVAMTVEEEIEAIVLAEPSILPTVLTYLTRGALIDHPEPTEVLPVTVMQTQRVPQWDNGQASTQQKNDKIIIDQEVLRRLNLAQVALQPIPEKIQRDSETSLRRFRHSTNLQVSKAGSAKIGATLVIDQIIKAMSGILEIAQTSYGRVTLEIAVGHIYVGKNEHGINRVIEQSDWLSAFKTRNGADHVPTYFSSVLTTSWTDAKFMVGLKLPSSATMFNETPAETRITYLIECANRYTQQDYTIEVDQTGKTVIYNNPQSIGSVNCHFLKRVWDASFRLNETTLANLDPQDPIKSVADNLWVRSATLAVLGGRIAGPEVGITSVRVRRQKAYTCMHNPDLLLRLTEVQDLVLVWRADQQFQAYAEPQEHMIKDDNRTWWEASITSKAADRALAENQNLELGEVVNWTLDDIVGMCILHDMFHLAEQVVTRIDSVGYGCMAVLFPPPPSTSRSIAKTSSKTSRDKKYTQGWSDW